MVSTTLAYVLAASTGFNIFPHVLDLLQNDAYRRQPVQPNPVPVLQEVMTSPIYSSETSDELIIVHVLESGQDLVSVMPLQNDILVDSSSSSTATDRFDPTPVVSLASTMSISERIAGDVLSMTRQQDVLHSEPRETTRDDSRITSSFAFLRFGYLYCLDYLQPLIDNELAIEDVGLVIVSWALLIVVRYARPLRRSKATPATYLQVQSSSALHRSSALPAFISSHASSPTRRMISSPSPSVRIPSPVSESKTDAELHLSPPHPSVPAHFSFSDPATSKVLPTTYIPPHRRPLHMLRDYAHSNDESPCTGRTVRFTSDDLSHRNTSTSANLFETGHTSPSSQQGNFDQYLDDSCLPLNADSSGDWRQRDPFRAIDQIFFNKYYYRAEDHKVVSWSICFVLNSMDIDVCFSSMILEVAKRRNLQEGGLRIPWNNSKGSCNPHNQDCKASIAQVTHFSPT